MSKSCHFKTLNLKMCKKNKQKKPKIINHNRNSCSQLTNHWYVIFSIFSYKFIYDNSRWCWHEMRWLLHKSTSRTWLRPADPNDEVNTKHMASTNLTKPTLKAADRWPLAWIMQPHNWHCGCARRPNTASHGKYYSQVDWVNTRETAPW